MKTCILTIIKNEHEYLDEWIRYHLDLGIDHIFIFEDIDSESHKEITDKYGERVSLESPLIALNEADQKIAQELKKTHKWNIQHLYFRNGLQYIKDNYQYDWCFVIDCDEFITTDGNNINDVVSIYKDYDAFILWWKCYGAGGRIKKPDYNDNGVVNVYTQEMLGRIQNEDKSLFKTCHNLKTYKKEYFYNQHYPSDKCNWCNTDCLRDKTILTYNHIYIRHYITRSWEEYVWKRKIRGFPWGGTRTYDFFFDINPDMLSLKPQLIKDLNKETLVVLPYVQNRSQGKEIRLTLNGWKKYCGFKYHFIVIGEFDETLINDYPWVEFIYKKRVDWRSDQYIPHLDMMSKFKYVMEKYSGEYNGFIYMTDDNYAVKPFTLEDITSIYYLNPSFTGREDQPASYWNHDKWKTRQLLDREGLPHVNYTTHFPYYMEFDKLKEIMSKYNLLEESYVFDDIYFNYFSHPAPLQVNCIRLGIWSKKDFDEKFQNAVNDPNIKFICNSVEGWSKELEQELSKLVE